MSRFLLPGVALAAFAVLLLFLFRGLQLAPTVTQIPSPLIDKAAPAFSLPTLVDPDRTITNMELAGRPSLVNVWATWCVGCRAEHGFLVALAEQNVIPIYGLNWKDKREPALAWLQQLGNPYVVNAFDEDGDVAIEWGVYGAPETFLLDKSGRIRHKHVGPLNAEIWSRDFAPRLVELR